MDMVSVNTVARNAITEKQTINDNTARIDNSNSKTAMNVMTEEQCKEVEEHIKKVFQDLVTSKNIETYEEKKKSKMKATKNVVQKEKQIEYNNIMTSNSLGKSEHHYNHSLTYKRKNYWSCINDNRSLHEQTLSFTIQRKPYESYFINSQRKSYNPLSFNDQFSKYPINSYDNHSRTCSIYNQRESSYLISMNSIPLSNTYHLHSQRDNTYSSTINSQRNLFDNQYFLDYGSCCNNEYSTKLVHYRYL